MPLIPVRPLMLSMALYTQHMYIHIHNICMCCAFLMLPSPATSRPFHGSHVVMSFLLMKLIFEGWFFCQLIPEQPSPPPLLSLTRKASIMVGSVIFLFDVTFIACMPLQSFLNIFFTDSLGFSHHASQPHSLPSPFGSALHPCSSLLPREP